jgi:hypothetical protein
MSLAFSRRLPAWLLIATAVLALALFPWPRVARQWLSGEEGLVELATVAFALWGAWVATRITLDRNRLPHPTMALWFAVFVLGLLLWAAEEASWGQSWFHWETPPAYAAINRQGETNLHNLSSLSEELPKTLLLAAALVGGIFWPIWASVKNRGPYLGTGWFSWLWPTTLIWPAAAVTWVMRIAERVLVNTNLEDAFVLGLPLRPIYIATRESIELYAVVFVLAYLWDVRRRMLAAPVAAGDHQSMGEFSQSNALPVSKQDRESMTRSSLSAE